MSLSERVVEPEVMDSREEAVDYDAMDHAEVNQRFVADFLTSWNSRDGGESARLLDLGTGTAQIPIDLCRACPTAQVVGIDLAKEMLKVGLENIERAGLSGQIELAEVDAKSLPYRDGSFDGVISNSIVHHIPRPELVLAEAVRVVRPGGLLFVRDLYRPTDEPTLRHLVDTYAGDANAHQQKMFEDSLRAALTLEEIRDLAAGLGLGPNSVNMTSDRHWTLISRK